MADHDTLRFVTELGGKLATRSRHICLFLGAGVGHACGLPDVATLQTGVLQSLDKNNRDAFQRQLTGRNLEQGLSRLRRIAALLEGNDTVDGLTAADAAALDKAVCHEIVKRLDVATADLRPMLHLAGLDVQRTDCR